MRVYYFMGDILSPLAGLALGVFSLITKTPRSRVVLYDEAGRVLLVQNVFGRDKWSLPGGGVERGEEPAKAAARELLEEAGIVKSTGDFKQLFAINHGGHSEVVFRASALHADLPIVSPSKFEIKALGWFAVDSLPALDKLSCRVMAGLGAER